tara:strand:- start:138 stop:326 length:189 start_codon:yes stop_codon:yes gene_type:complete
MNIFDEVIQTYVNEIQKLKNILGEGGAENFSHYQNIVGTIKGIEWSRNTLVETIKNINKEEE